MRCFLMRNGHIAAVEMLDPGADDKLIEQSHGHFERRSSERFDDFEVWDGTRRVYSRSENQPRPQPGRR